MPEDLKTPVPHYAVALLKKLVSPQANGDPSAADFARLSAPMHEIALAVISEGRDKGARQNRLKAEISARGLDPLMREIDSADAQEDLSVLQTSTGWAAFDLVDVVAEELPSINWIVKPYLSRPSVVCFFGRAKSMKSLLLLDLCMHVAGGLAWLTSAPKGTDGIQIQQARVVWLDLEGSAVTLKHRMKAIANPLGIGQTRDQLIVYSMPTPWPDLSKVENAAALITRLQALGDIGLLVVDHLGMVFGSIEENSASASLVMQNIRQVSEACNLAIALVHHAKKGVGKDSGDPADMLRGSGAILAGVDSAFIVERDKSERNQLKLSPVATRGAEVAIESAVFRYERDANLDLTEARFWRLQYRTNSVRARDAILEALGTGKKNYTELRAAVKETESGVSDQAIRDQIAILAGTGEIIFTEGKRGAHIYRLAEAKDEDE